MIAIVESGRYISTIPIFKAYGKKRKNESPLLNANKPFVCTQIAGGSYKFTAETEDGKVGATF